MISNDTPITIADGSLTIESAVPWASYSGSGSNTKVHPHTGKSASKVEISMPDKNQTVTFSGEKCTVAVRYASTDITVTTGDDGKGLQVTTDFSSFHDGATPNHLEHNDASSKISHVTVTQGDQKKFDSGASRDTKVKVHYQ
jgi:hypothetical protein